MRRKIQTLLILVTMVCLCLGAARAQSDDEFAPSSGRLVKSLSEAAKIPIVVLHVRNNPR
jgi:hypothetical protein